MQLQEKMHQKKIPKKLEYYKIDVTSQSEWNALEKYIKKKYNKLDILINNAGVRISGDINNTSLDLWNHIIRTNLTSIFLGAFFLVVAITIHPSFIN